MKNANNTVQAASQKGSKPSFWTFRHVLTSLTLLACVLVVMWMGAFLTSRYTSNRPFGDIEKAMVEQLDETVYPAQDHLALKRYYNLDPDLFMHSSVYRKGDAMSASEMVLVQFDSPEAAEAFEKAMTERRDSQVDIFSGYAADQAALAKKAVVDVQGNYALFYIGDNPNEIDERFLESLRG